MERNIIQGLLWLGTFGAALTALAQLTVYLKLQRARRACLLRTKQPDFTPPISILKPLKGVDDNLYGNLVSFIRQDYPRFELLLGVDDVDDPAVAIARQLQRDFPRAPIRLVIRHNRIGLNPKINNLINLLDESCFEHILISDSNVIVEPDYLRETVAELADAKVGLVSNVIVGDGERTLGSWIENFHLNTFVLAGVCIGDWLGHPVVVGKSMLMRRADLQRLGGFHALRDVLAEDYVLGVRFHEAGQRVVLSPHAVRTVNQHWSMSRTLSRHGRWAKLRRFLQPAAFLLEPAALSGLWFLLALTIALLEGDGSNVQLSLVGLFTKATLDVALFGFVRGAPPSLIAWPVSILRDCLLLSVWLQACVSRTVQWRGNRLRIGKGTRLRPVHQGAHGGVVEVLLREPLG